MLVALLPFIVGGCASSPYAANRGRDLADVFTLTLGGGSGAKARVGPVQLAIIDHVDLLGLRAGTGFANGEDMLDNTEIYQPWPRGSKANYDDFAVRRVFETGQGKVVDVRGEDTLIDSPMYQRRWHDAFGHERFDPGPDSLTAQRGKTIAARSPFPFYTASDNPAHMTQIEIAGGLGLTIRLGFNPGELIDFILGFTSMDLYGDDL